MPDPLFDCADCELNTHEANEYYMVWDWLWDAVAKRNEMLCIGCLEARMGRRLAPGDFTLALVNQDGGGGIYEQSPRLRERLGYA